MINYTSIYVNGSVNLRNMLKKLTPHIDEKEMSQVCSREGLKKVTITWKEKVGMFMTIKENIPAAFKSAKEERIENQKMAKLLGEDHGYEALTYPQNNKIIQQHLESVLTEIKKGKKLTFIQYLYTKV